jgi:hypothetical protein
MQAHYRIARVPAPLDPNLIALLSEVETATIGHLNI